MSDPQDLLDQLDAVEDAFVHMGGRPQFEPGVNDDTNAAVGEVQIQKACRLLDLTRILDDLGEYYGAMLEQSYIAIEHTFQGYLLIITGAEERDLRDHAKPYELAKGQVPLSDGTIERLEQLYDARRTKHYYGTTVTTKQQALRMRDVAETVHEHVVEFDHEVEQYCNCP